jgi:hypothetical protein
VRGLCCLLGLAILATLVLAPAALAEDLKSCGDFPFQAAAQAYYRANPADSALLDENANGIACETYPYPAGTPREESPVTPPQQPQGGEQAKAEEGYPLPQSGDPVAEAILPYRDTLLAGSLLIGLGALALFVFGRKRGLQ